MSWLTLTEAHILTGVTGAELAPARAAALKAGQVDPVAEVIAQVTREVRGRVAACARNTLGEGDAIPDECLSAAIDIAVYRLCKRIPGAVLLTKERVEANTNAIAYLRDVAACEVALVQPATAATEQPGGPAAQVVTTTTRRATRDRLSGL